MNFFKEFKENSSINNIGSKIKNISQTNWLPETKEIISNAASSIATNLEPNATQSNMTSTPKTPQPIRQKTNSINSPVSSSKVNYRQATINQHSTDTRHAYEEDEPMYESNKKLPQKPSPSSRPKKMPLSRNSSYRSRSPDSPLDDPNKIDPLQYTALAETNQALKIELQRLSVYETKCKQLEKELSSLNALKETNDKLEDKVKDLSQFEDRCKKLENELDNLKTKSEKIRQNFDILTDENISLTNKIKDLNRVIEENEQTVFQLRNNESVLKHELEALRESNLDLNEEKIRSLEQANQILENEMQSMKQQQKVEREKLKEKVTLLNSKHTERVKKIEEEKKSLELELDNIRNSLQENGEMHRELVTLKDLNLKYEDEIEYLKEQLGEKKSELDQMMKQREAEIQNYLDKMKLLNDENLNMCNQFSSDSVSKDEQLNHLDRKLVDAENQLELVKSKNDSLQKKLADKQDEIESLLKINTSLKLMEKKCAELTEKNCTSEDLIKHLKFENQNLKHEVKESNSLSQQLKNQLSNLSQINEKITADFSLSQIQVEKLESFKNKCENLEKELNELKRLKSHAINDFESHSRKLSESGDKYEYEIKVLNTQINSLHNDLRLKDQEYIQIEKLLESEKRKTSSLLHQIDELKTSNSDLSMQLSDLKRRLVSLDLITEECNQLRKSLTAITIESESKKAECMTLNSQVNILETTLKSLRDSNNKHNNLENNLENVTLELRKKHDDYKKLQQVHDSIKKEQLETIEMLEDKLKDVEKKTELQALKHEEILLELESIRARRERLMPLCPNCSQAYSIYQTNQSQVHSQGHSPKNQYVPYVHPNGQLLSIAIPQQSIMSPMISPLQTHLPQFQVITLPGKQSVTVECQTSPHLKDPKAASGLKQEQIEHQAIEKYKKEIQKSKFNRSAQTYDFNVKKFMENRASNTERIELETKSNQTAQSGELIQIKPLVKNQAINVNIFDEIKRNSSVQTTPVMPKVCEEKSSQCNSQDWPKEKYYLYLIRHSYDPFKNSPNQNPALELPLKAGDYLFVLSDKEDEGYFSSELLTGKRGLTPSNFIERVKLDVGTFFSLIESLPKELLSNPKMSEVLNTHEIKLGNLLIQFQEYIQKLKSNCVKNDLLITGPQAVVAPKQTLVSKNDKQYLSDQSKEEQIKIGLPYPNNLRVEKRSEKSLLIYWDPPSAPLPIDHSLDTDFNPINDLNTNIQVAYYNLFLNNELHSVINGNDEQIAVIDDIDLSVPNRISIQAVASKERMSKPQECTLLFGSNCSFAPSNLTVHNLSQTTAIVSWLPSSSQFSHIISIDSIEHRTLKPGVYRFKLSGLFPDTSHLITVTAQIHNHTNELNSNYASSIEFRTLASRTLAQPTQLCIEKDPSETDAFIISWTPVATMSNQMSNGIPVGGYSIYLDGTRVHQILNPTASSVTLSNKLLSNAKLLSLRTLSLDGNSESRDSEYIKLSKSLFDELTRKCSRQEPIGGLHRAKLVQSEPAKRVPAQVSQMPKLADANRKKNAENRLSVENDADLYENNRSNPLPAASNTRKSSRQSSPSSSVGTASKPRSKSKVGKNYRIFIALFDYDPLKMSPNTDSCQEELPFKKGQLIKIYGEQDADGFFYGESNGRSGYIPCNMVSEVPPEEQEAVNKIIESDERNRAKSSTGQKVSKSSKVSNVKQIGAKAGKQDRQFMPINKHTKCATMIALYDYDPQSLSPNMDADAELAFKTGQIITVYDNMDEDGFFMGEINGKRGLVPSNFLQPFDPNSQYLEKK